MSPEVVGTTAQRVYEQPPDALVCYSDMAQLTASEHEVIVQFYESIPGPPHAGGGPQSVRTRLRATIIVSKSHAAKIAAGLLQASSSTVTPPVKQPPKPPATP
jgi:predicted RecB family endonuclease